MLVDDLEGYELGWASRVEPRNNPYSSWRNNLVCYSSKTELFYFAFNQKIQIFKRCNTQLIKMDMVVDNSDPSVEPTARFRLFNGPQINYMTIADCGNVEYLICLMGNGRVMLRSTGNVTGTPLVFNIGHSAWSAAMAKDGPYLAIGHNGGRVDILDISLPPGVAEASARQLFCAGHVPCVAFSRGTKWLLAAILAHGDGYPGLAETRIAEELINGMCPEDGYGNNWACLYLRGEHFTNKYQSDCQSLIHVPELDDPEYEFSFWTSENAIFFGRFDREARNFTGQGEWWTETFASVDWSEHNKDIQSRLNLVKHIPQLGVLVVANQFGAIRVIELCHRDARTSTDKDSLYSFRLVAVLSVDSGLGHRGETVADLSKIHAGQPIKDPGAWVLQSGCSESGETNEQVFMGLDVVTHEQDESAEIVAFVNTNEILFWTIRRQPIKASKMILERSLGR